MMIGRKVKEEKKVIKWFPQPRQLKFLRACGLSHPFDGGSPKAPVADLIGFGGAAGGGKTDANLGLAIIFALSFPGSVTGIFRRTFTQLSGSGGIIWRSQQLLAGIAEWKSSEHKWVFPNGSIIQFNYIQYEKDVHNYHSAQFDLIIFDEATQFLPSMITYMLTRLRATSDKIIRPFMVLTTNPGNIGHAFFRKVFVKSGPVEVPHEAEIEENKPRKVIFIPSKLSDNKILEDRDPNYRKNLESQPEHIKRMLLDGDWDVAKGMAFEEWREEVHTIDPFAIDPEWKRFRALDWGHAKPYSVGWYAIDYDGRLYKYRELYGWSGEDDVGTREDPEDVAYKIIEAERLPDGSRERIDYAVADDAIFGGRQDNSKSIAEQFAEVFGNRATHWMPVGKGRGSRVSGKLEVHSRLKWTRDDNGRWNGERPMLVIFKTCIHTIRTLPSLVLDEHNPEDVNTKMEDHAYDETRYACMSRPMAPSRKEEEGGVIARHKKKIAKKTQQSHLRRII